MWGPKPSKAANIPSIFSLSNKIQKSLPPLFLNNSLDRRIRSPSALENLRRGSATAIANSATAQMTSRSFIFQWEAEA